MQEKDRDKLLRNRDHRAFHWRARSLDKDAPAFRTVQRIGHIVSHHARSKSARHAVVVRFSKSRRRYERQGLLVEPQALTEAQRELAPQTR